MKPISCAVLVERSSSWSRPYYLRLFSYFVRKPGDFRVVGVASFDVSTLSMQVAFHGTPEKVTSCSDRRAQGENYDKISPRSAGSVPLLKKLTARNLEFLEVRLNLEPPSRNEFPGCAHSSSPNMSMITSTTWSKWGCGAFLTTLPT